MDGEPEARGATFVVSGVLSLRAAIHHSPLVEVVNFPLSDTKGC